MSVVEGHLNSAKAPTGTCEDLVCGGLAGWAGMHYLSICVRYGAEVELVKLHAPACALAGAGTDCT